MDISDPLRFFLDEEWASLDNDTCREIQQNPERKTAIQNRKNNKRMAVAAELGNRFILDDDTAAIITNGVKNALHQNQSTISVVADIRGLQLNGSTNAAGGKNGMAGCWSREVSDTHKQRDLQSQQGRCGQMK